MEVSIEMFVAQMVMAMPTKKNGTYDANPRTKALRPQTTLSPQQIEEARNKRRDGLNPDDIAKDMNQPVDQINLALANLRTTVRDPDRRTLNVSPEMHAYVMSNLQKGESVKDALDRLFLRKDK